MTNRTFWIFTLFAVMGTPSFADDKSDIAAVLDDYHDAAAHGDKSRYLNHLTDNGVFMGTDEWERWPKPELTAYVSRRFKDGKGWNYKAVDRNIMVSADGKTAWFDEVTFSEKSGRFRGTGTLLKQGNEWKIAHYAMSFIILNENWPAVTKLTKETRAKKAKEDKK